MGEWLKPSVCKTDYHRWFESNHVLQDINKKSLSGHLYLYNTFQISLYFISLEETSKKVSFFFVSNVSGSFLVSKHTKKMPKIKPSHREYCLNHSRKSPYRLEFFSQQSSSFARTTSYHLLNL